MKKITYILLAVIALFVNSTVYAVEARIPTTSITQALQNAKSKKNFSTLKSAKFDVENKVYNISYVAKDGSIENVRINKANHRSKTLRYCRVSSNRELKKDKNNEYERSSHFSFNKLEKF